MKRTLPLALLALSACTTTKRVAVALQPPTERLQCVSAGTRPIIPPEAVIDWSKVLTVPQSHSEHDRFVASVRTREGVVAKYVLDTESKLFLCASNAQWMKDWYAGMATTPVSP